MASILGWFTPTLKPRRLVCRSRVCYWREHWLDESGNSARCMESECLLCPDLPRRMMACIAVSEIGSHQVRLLKLPPGAEDFVEQLEARQLEAVGLIINVCAISRQKSDGIEIISESYTSVREVPITKYCAAIGRKAYQLAIMTRSSQEKLIG